MKVKSESENESEDGSEDNDDLCEIKETFTNFNDDIVFEGTKQLVKFRLFDSTNMKIETIFIDKYRSIGNYENRPKLRLGNSRCKLY